MKSFSPSSYVKVTKIESVFSLFVILIKKLSLELKGCHLVSSSLKTARNLEIREWWNWKNVLKLSNLYLLTHSTLLVSKCILIALLLSAQNINTFLIKITAATKQMFTSAFMTYWISSGVFFYCRGFLFNFVLLVCKRHKLNFCKRPLYKK